MGTFSPFSGHFLQLMGMFFTVRGDGKLLRQSSKFKAGTVWRLANNFMPHGRWCRGWKSQWEFAVFCRPVRTSLTNNNELGIYREGREGGRRILRQDVQDSEALRLGHEEMRANPWNVYGNGCCH